MFCSVHIYFIGVNSSNGGITNPKCGDGYSVPQGEGGSFFCRPSLYGRYVTIRRHDDRIVAFSLCEVEVYSVRRGREPSRISVMHYALLSSLMGQGKNIVRSLSHFLRHGDYG